jgi:3,4-dihydroxy 2-butanone 4-phosphate synthase/GTP cyclohydrolase II
MREHLAGIEDAIAAIGRGEIVVVVDDPDRENEGDFVMAAEKVTPQAVNFMITHGRGLLCVPLTGLRCDALELRPMSSGASQGLHGTAFTVSVDLAGPGTGISAPERAACIRHLVSPEATTEDFVVPGHVFPLRAEAGGVLERRGHTEAACDLARLAGLEPAGAICEIIADDGTMARGAQLVDIAREHGLLLISVEDLVAYRRRREVVVQRGPAAMIPTPYAGFRTVCYTEQPDGIDHVVLVLGAVSGRHGVPLSVHVECPLGDVLAGGACGCGTRLHDSMRRVAGAGAGVIVIQRRTNGPWSCGADVGPNPDVTAHILADLAVASTVPAADAPAATLGLTAAR